MRSDRGLQLPISEPDRPHRLRPGIAGLIQAFDWASTPLGEAKVWPQSLRTALSFMLSSVVPTCIGWGPDLTGFFNDACLPLLDADLESIGRPLREFWPEAWGSLGPLAERVMSGESCILQSSPLTLVADGRERKERFVFSYGPIHDESGGAGGVVCSITEQAAKDRSDGHATTVYLIAASASPHGGLERCLQQAGHHVRCFSSPRDFLEVASLLMPGCIVLEAEPSDCASLHIASQLKARSLKLPVVAVGKVQGDVPLAVAAMKAGAFEFVETALSENALLDAVASALCELSCGSGGQTRANLLQYRLAEMPLRERQVLDGLLLGGTNKSIARSLGLSPRTIEVHRARLMKHMGVKNVAELLRIALADTQTPH